MVTAVTKWWQLWQAFLTGIKYLKTQCLRGFAVLWWILLKTIHETGVSPMSPKWFKNGDSWKPVFTRVWGQLSPMSPLFIYKTLRYYIIYTLIFTCKYSCKMNNIYYSILKRILKRFLAKNGDSGDRTLVRICLRIFLMCKIVVRKEDNEDTCYE